MRAGGGRLQALGRWAVAALFLRAGAAGAQDVDLLRTEHDSAGMRAAGLGGALVGLADDVSASGANPAGLAALPRALDISLGVGGPGDRGTPAYFGVAIRPSRIFGISVRAGRPPRETLYAGRSADEATSNPTAAGWFVGGAVGVRATRRLSAGFSLVRQRLAVSTGEPSTLVTHRDGSWSYSAGLLMRPDEPLAPSVGLAYRHRLDIDAESTSPDVGEGAALIGIRTPRVFSAGVSWHYDIRSTRARFTYQQDLIRFSEFPATDGERGPQDDFDFRLGTEWTFPLLRGDCYSGCGSMVQVRGAIVSRAPLPLDSIGVSARAQREDRRKNSWAAGFSLAPPRILTGRIKFEASYSRWSRTFLAGVAFRYPRAYRGDQASAGPDEN